MSAGPFPTPPQRGAIETAERLYTLGQLPIAGATRPNRNGDWKVPITAIAAFYQSRPSWTVLEPYFSDAGQLIWGFGRWDADLSDGRIRRCFGLDIDADDAAHALT